MPVTLRDYAQWEDQNGGSIAEYIESRAKSHYQASPPAGAVEYLLVSGRAFVIFDGLDELLDTSRRQEIVANVTSFSTRYSNAAILATSRRVGYHEAPLDPSIFEEVQLAQLSEAAVEDYVTKWFALDATKNASERKQLVLAFLRESKEVADIRSNPLLLALLCNIYRVENYIPTSRAEVYRSCATMLFEKWDSRRGIRVELPYRRHLEPAIKHLAYWIYSNAKLQSGITELLLVQETVKYLVPDRIEDEDEAREVAEAFVSFCKGRAWIFTDTGTTAAGAPLYQFTHRTFLEYFTAGYLVRVSPTADSLWRRLKAHILHQEWDVVAQLSLQMKDEQGEGAAAEFLTLLLREAKRRKGMQLRNLLSFSIRSLDVVAPGQRVVRSAIDQTIDYCMTSYIRKRKNWAVVTEQSEQLTELVKVRGDNRSIVIRAANDRLAAIIKSGSMQEQVRAAMLGLTLSLSRGVGTDHSVVAALDRDLNTTASQSIEVAVMLHACGHIPTKEFVEYHGLQGLFMPSGIDFSYGDVIAFPSVANILFYWLRFGKDPWESRLGFNRSRAAKELAAIGRSGLARIGDRPPKMAALAGIKAWYSIGQRSEEDFTETHLDGDTIFAGFLIGAIGIESELPRLLLELDMQRLGALSSLEGIFLVRRGLRAKARRIEEPSAPPLMQSSDSSTAMAWAAGKISFMS